jgi:pimeloyl-ACP methyl ester carboxylesterase
MLACNANAVYMNPNPGASGFHMYTAAIDVGAGAIWIDGVPQASTFFTQSALGGFTRIGYNLSTSEYSDFDIFEILFWNKLLSVSAPFERAGVMRFVSDKYNLGFVGGASIDPATLNPTGWWKADTLFNPQFTTLDTTLSGDNVRIMIPRPNRVAGTALIWCHGLGGSEKDITNAPNINYTYAAMAAGHLVAACNGFGYNWDNPTAQAALEALVAHLAANYGVTKAVLFGGSAGGPLGLLKATQGFPGVSVKGWHGIFPIVNLDAAHSNSSLTASINAAFPGYPGSAAGRDPILFPASAYNGLRLRCYQSAADTVAPKAIHGDALVTLATGHAVEVACIATSGDHGDPSNSTPSMVNDFVSFVGRCFSG